MDNLGFESDIRVDSRMASGPRKSRKMAERSVTDGHKANYGEIKLNIKTNQTKRSVSIPKKTSDERTKLRSADNIGTKKTLDNSASTEALDTSRTQDSGTKTISISDTAETVDKDLAQPRHERISSITTEKVMFEAKKSGLENSVVTTALKKKTDEDHDVPQSSDGPKMSPKSGRKSSLNENDISIVSSKDVNNVTRNCEAVSATIVCNSVELKNANITELEIKPSIEETGESIRTEMKKDEQIRKGFESDSSESGEGHGEMHGYSSDLESIVSSEAKRIGNNTTDVSISGDNGTELDNSTNVSINTHKIERTQSAKGTDISFPKNVKDRFANNDTRNDYSAELSKPSVEPLLSGDIPKPTAERSSIRSNEAENKTDDLRLDSREMEQIEKQRKAVSGNVIHANGIKPSSGAYGQDIESGIVLDPTQLSQVRAEEEVDKLLSKQEVNGRPKVFVQRSLFTQKHFDESFEAGRRPSPTFRQVIRKQLSKCRCSGACVKQFFFGLFPFIAIMKAYNLRQDITGDIVSGLTIGIMHIPQGMAYGMLTTLPPVYGLYMSFFPVLIYFFFGSSKHASTGTFAVACLMVGSAVSKGLKSVSTSQGGSGSLSVIDGNQTTMAPIVNITTFNASDLTTGFPIVQPPASGGDAMSQEELDLRLQFAMSVSFVAGVIQLLMGVFRLGFITVYLSDPLISGFTTGAACHVFTSQIKHVFGIKTARYSGAFKLVYTYGDFFKNIETTNMVTVLLSIVCIAMLYCTTRFINQNPKLKPKMVMPVPIELIVVVLGTVISYAIKLETEHHVAVVSDIPTGLPVPDLKPFSRIGDVISDAIALAIVVFAISVSMGKLLAKKHDYDIDPNQELVAYGIATIVSSFLSSSAPSASLSRSLVQEGVGGKTQVAGLVSCCLLLIVLLAIGPYFRTLPNCVLASIIIVALRGMFLQVLDLKKLWRVSLIDFFVWIVAFVATVLLDVDLGLGVAVIFNIITVVCRSQRPYATLLGQIPGTDIYRDMNIYQEAQEIPGIKIFRFEHSLFFVNTEHFKTFLYKRTVNPRTIKAARKKREDKLKKLKKQELVIVGEETPDVSIPIDALDMELDTQTGDMKVTVIAQKQRPPPDVDFHTIILDCSPWSFIDSMGVKVLVGVIAEYKAVGINIVLANCKGGIREMFGKTKFYDTLDHSSMYVSLHDAIVQAQHNEVPAQNTDTSDLTDQRGTSLEGSSMIDRDESETDYNMDYVDEDETEKEKKKPANGSTS